MTLIRRIAVVACGLGLLAGCTSEKSGGAAPSTSAVGGSASGSTARGTVPSSDPAKEAAISKLVEDTMKADNLRAVIVRVTVDGKEVTTRAFGESMTGVPATTDMHFRNGAVAISYVSTLLLQLVDEKKVSLDDKVSKWLPDLPHGNEVTLGQLAQMTSGYVDFVIGNDQVQNLLYADPYRQWTPQELLAYVVDKPLLYPPGTNWNYAHTNYLILGLALEKITGRPVNQSLDEKVLGPLGLTNTSGNAGTPAIPDPALHAFTSERRPFLSIPAATPFYEESTFWNPSWTITQGAIQTTNIYDLAATAAGIGSGKLLSPESYQKMISTDLRGKTTALPACPATCFPQQEGYSYGIGIVTTGNWVMQDPLFSGEAGAFGYLPSQKVSVAVAVTFAPGAFKPDGSYENSADNLWREIGALVAPSDPPPIKKS